MTGPQESASFSERGSQTEPWLAALLDGLPTPTLLVEPGSARVLFANRAAHRLAGGRLPTGVALEDYDSVYFCTDADGHRIPAAALPTARVARGEDVDDYEMNWHTAAGVRSLLLSARALPLADHPPTAVVVFDDVTALKAAEDRLRDQLDFTRAIAESLGEGVYAVDLEGCTTFLNPAGERLLGWTADELEGRPMHDTIHFQRADGTRLARHDCPLFEVTRSGRMVEVEEDVFTRRDGELLTVAYSSAPIVTDGRITGAVVAFRDVAERERAERERADLLQRERAARAAAEAHERRSAFLADATTLVATSLDYETTLRSLARLAVPTLADWCVIDVIDERREPRRVAVGHGDPGAAELAERVRGVGTDRGGRLGIHEVLRTGRPLLAEDFERAVTPHGPLEGEQGDVLRAMAPCSYMIVPLLARGHTLGAVTLVAASSGRRYDAEDLRLAEDLAHRAGQSVDNARLYREAQESSARRRRQVEQLAELTDASLAVAARRTVPDVLQAAAGGARALVDADAALVRLLPASPAEPPVDALARAEGPDRWSGSADVVAGGELGALARATGRSVRLDGEGLRADPAWSAGGAGAPPGGWLGAPLVGRDGVNLGLLAVAGRGQEEELSAEDEAVLVQLAQIVSVALENVRLLEERGHVARTLQQSLLPPRLPAIAGVGLAARYRAVGEVNQVGGDFYDVFEVGPRSWGIVIGDVCGKGAEAAAVTALARYTLRAAATTESAPARILEILNTAMLSQRGDYRFATVAYARLDLDPDGARATICSAGHPLPLLRRAGEPLAPVGHPGTLLGVVPEPDLDERSVELAPGDALIFYTDGVTEARAPELLLDVEQIGARLGPCGPGATELARCVERIALEVAGGSPRDDLAVLVARLDDERPQAQSVTPSSQARRVTSAAAAAPPRPATSARRSPSSP